MVQGVDYMPKLQGQADNSGLVNQIIPSLATDWFREGHVTAFANLVGLRTEKLSFCFLSLRYLRRMKCADL